MAAPIIRLPLSDVEFPPFALRTDIACRNVDPDLFFPATSTPTSAIPARRICYSCPARRECRDWAIDNDVKGGVYGGLTERERRHRKARLTQNRRQHDPAQGHRSGCA